jgi:hypothetical protein
VRCRLSRSNSKPDDLSGIKKFGNKGTAVSSSRQVAELQSTLSERASLKPFQLKVASSHSSPILQNTLDLDKNGRTMRPTAKLFALALLLNTHLQLL